MAKIPLVLDQTSIREIAREVHRIFQLHTDNITVRGDEFCLQIMIYPERSQTIKLPSGPIEVRVWEEKIELLLEGRL